MRREENTLYPLSHVSNITGTITTHTTFIFSCDNLKLIVFYSKSKHGNPTVTPLEILTIEANFFKNFVSPRHFRYLFYLILKSI